MAKISFNKQFQAKKNTAVEKLTLKYGEKKRVALIGDLEAAYTHNLTKIQLDPDTGEVRMETKKKRDGGEFQVPMNDYVGKFKCTGDYDTVFENGTDGENCVFCAAAESSGAFSAPDRYTTCLAFVYETKPNTFAAQLKPFQGKVIPWVFPDGKWNTLSDINDSFESMGGVYNVDLQLGPCQGAFQNYDIGANPVCEWKADPKREEYVKELMEAYDEDLSTLFGREANAGEAQRYIKEVQDQYDAGYNPSKKPNDRLSSSSSDAVDTLFSGEDSVEYGDDDESEGDKDASGVRNIEDLIEF